MKQDSSLSDNRHIRIFISSTFQDLQVERDYLMKKVFPLIEDTAAKRGVIVTPIDLRWGITEADAHSGKVLDICLQEIDNSHPFFIGILGNRYGWCPPMEDYEQNEEMRVKWGDWLRQDLANGLSVTEIEMQYGALRNKNRSHAAFYIRKDEDDRNTTEKTSKLAKLKIAIRKNSQHYPVNEFSTPQQLGEFVMQDFMALLNQLFPTEKRANLEAEDIAQRMFVQRCLKEYIHYEKNSRLIDDFVTDVNSRILVLAGFQGTGKSTLLVNWIHHNSYFPSDSIVYYAVGVGSSSVKSQHIWDRLRCMDKTPALIIIDGVDKMKTSERCILVRKFSTLPKETKIILSTIPGDEIIALLYFLGETISWMRCLPMKKRQQLVKKHLGNYSKKLPQNQINRLLRSRVSYNPNLLKAFLNELISYGVHERLGEQIDKFISFFRVDDLLFWIIQRYETDFGKSFVDEILCLLHLSETGLSERQILKLTGISQITWSQFYCAFKPYLRTYDGKLNFSIMEMKQLNIYDEETRNSCRDKLIKFGLMNILPAPQAVTEIKNDSKSVRQWCDTLLTLMSQTGSLTLQVAYTYTKLGNVFYNTPFRSNAYICFMIAQDIHTYILGNDEYDDELEFKIDQCLEYIDMDDELQTLSYINLPPR